MDRHAFLSSGRRFRVALAPLLALVLACMAGTARADIWGFIDDSGQTHLATARVDARYTLFMKGGAVADEAAGRTVPGTASDGLTKTRLFQRLVASPNIARFEPLIRAAAERSGLDADLVKAVVAVESGFEPTAVSDKGAVGLMQVLPATGERYGVRPDRRRSIEQKLADPAINLDVGTRYLADLRRQFAARPELALAAYNAGENAVVRHGNAIPPYAETEAYVKLVDQFHAFYRPVVRGNVAEVNGRLHVTIPARRNLPEPGVPLRLPAPAADIVVPPASERDAS